MHRTTRLAAASAIVVAAAVPLAACGGQSAPAPATTQPAPVKVEPIGDSGVKRLTLTDRAAQRLAIETAPVVREADRLVIPYAALLYLPDGTTFAYTNPQAHVYVREKVVVDMIRGAQAVLTAGPAPGTAVVTVGGTELWGAEFGIK